VDGADDLAAVDALEVIRALMPAGPHPQGATLGGLSARITAASGRAQRAMRVFPPAE